MYMLDCFALKTHSPAKTENVCPVAVCRACGSKVNYFKHHIWLITIVILFIYMYLYTSCWLMPLKRLYMLGFTSYVQYNCLDFIIFTQYHCQLIFILNAYCLYCYSIRMYTVYLFFLFLCCWYLRSTFGTKNVFGMNKVILTRW